MNTIMSLCDRIAALSFGRLIAEGRPADIARHPAVVEAYLGREHVF
jgi:branched-chain amino acid transport system ATP-binding protein